MAARDYVRLVLLGVDSVADISVVQTLLRQAAQAVRRFAEPSREEVGLALMGDRLQELLIGAQPGSDAQLAYVQALDGWRPLRSSPRVAGRPTRRNSDV